MSARYLKELAAKKNIYNLLYEKKLKYVKFILYYERWIITDELKISLKKVRNFKTIKYLHYIYSNFRNESRYTYAQNIFMTISFMIMTACSICSRVSVAQSTTVVRRPRIPYFAHHFPQSSSVFSWNRKLLFIQIIMLRVFAVLFQIHVVILVNSQKVRIWVS